MLAVTMRGLMAGLLGTVALAASPSLAAAAAAPQGAYDGSNPFVCTVQDVGFGTAYPQPEADPFCVRFNKTRQNVTQLGVVDFLSQEPTRVAAASNKCFYWQTDRWRGSVVQEDASTETYGYDGSYFFDKARGAGGVYVENFRVAGQSGDPTAVPGFPPEYRPYFGKGRGGFMFAGGEIDVEPRCVALAARGGVLRSPDTRRCRVPGGRIGRGIGGIRVRALRSAVRRDLGLPTSESPLTLRYCLDGGGTLVAGFRGPGDGRGASIVASDSPAFRSRALRPGLTLRQARRAMRRERVRRRGDGTRVLVARGKQRTLVAVVQGGRVRLIAVAARRVSLRALGRDLRMVG